jgi:hypothetical protein
MQESLHSMNSDELQMPHAQIGPAQIRQFVQVYEDGCVVARCAQCHDLIETLEPTRCFYCCAILCWKCWDDRQGVCRGCFYTVQAWTKRLQKAALASMHKSGRPRTLRMCPHCRQKLGARELRRHKPICAKEKQHDA